MKRDLVHVYNTCPMNIPGDIIKCQLQAQIWLVTDLFALAKLNIYSLNIKMKLMVIQNIFSNWYIWHSYTCNYILCTVVPSPRLILLGTITNTIKIPRNILRKLEALGSILEYP